MQTGSRVSAVRSACASLLLALLVSAACPGIARAADPRPADDASKRIDALLSATFKADGPGAAVVAVKNGKVIFRKGYGHANLELGVAMKPEMVFEIGSVTKQFTAVSILMLVEQGKISLDADIRTYLPDFPDKGEKITVEHLLTHTSGIKSYTSLSEWIPKIRQDIPLAELIGLFKDLPLEFKPGTQWDYSNSGYVLLGAIVEKVSGMPYASFIQKNIFDATGMKHSVYGDPSLIIPNRATGYNKNKDGFVNAEYHSMAHPYSAGAIMSTVDDLALWDAAVSSGKLLKKESWDRAFTDYKLANGTTAKYGYGWQIDSIKGQRTIHHGGGIPGYISEVVRMPEHGVFVALLTNSSPPMTDLSRMAKLVALEAAGMPYVEPKAITVEPSILDEYVGVYRINDKAIRTVKREGDHLTTQRTGGSVLPAHASSPSDFFYKESLTTFSFERENGKVVRMIMTTEDGNREVANKTNEAPPAERQAISVDPAILAGYVGEYEISLSTKVGVTVEGNQIFIQLTGQPRFELFAEGETKFFLKVVDAQIVFEKGADGKVTQLVIFQGGQQIPAKKK